MKKFLYLLLFCFLLMSCSETETTTTSYVGPGSEYSITFNESDSTFDLTESDASLTISGSYTTLASGFKKLTVGSVSGGGSEGPSAGDEAYGVDIPGVVFLLKPLEDNSEIIPMVSKGSCPTGDFSMNWIITGIETGASFRKSCNDGISTPKGIDALGTFSYTHSSTQGVLPKKFDICGNEFDESFDLGTITCSAGIATPADEAAAKMYLTANGGAIVKIEDDSGGDDDDDDTIIVGLPVNTVVKESLADDYIGMIMMNNPGGEDSVFLIKATVDSNAEITISEVAPDTDETITTNFKEALATMTDINQPSTGFSRGTYSVSVNNGSGGYTSYTNKKISCMSNQNINDTSKNFIFCVGEDTSSDQMLNVLLISK